AEKNIAVRVDIKASVNRPIGNSYRRLPGDSAVGGPLEFHAAAAAVNPIVQLILKPMARAVGLVDSEPFLVAAACLFVRLQLCPGLAAVGGAIHVVAEKRFLCVRFETEVEKLADLIRFCHRIAAKNIVFKNTGKRPCYTGISSVTPPALPEVGGNVVELSPADC